jgi:hypothetical protein
VSSVRHDTNYGDAPAILRLYRVTLTQAMMPENQEESMPSVFFAEAGTFFRPIWWDRGGTALGATIIVYVDSSRTSSKRQTWQR